MSITTAQRRDANRVPITTNEALIATKTVAFDGTAGNGAVGTVNLFTITGAVWVVSAFATCSESVAGATATIQLGITGATNTFIPSTTATSISVNTVWADNGPSIAEGTGLSRIIGASNTLLATIGTANITDGTLTFYVLWRPLSSDGNIVAT